MGNATIHAINIVQFLLGTLIFLTNAPIMLSLLNSRKTRSSSNLLFGNLCFSNLLVGFILAVANVVDGTLKEDIEWTQDKKNETIKVTGTPVLWKTEGTLAMANSYINIACILALITAKLVEIRSPESKLSSRSCMRFAAIIWIMLLMMLLAKAILSSLNLIGQAGACFECFLTFEVATLTIFTLVSILVFFVAKYLLIVHKKRSVHGEEIAEENPLPRPSGQDYKIFNTGGIVLVVFTLAFLLFLVIEASYIKNAHHIGLGTSEILITIFFFHCIINPVIIVLRDDELTRCVRSYIYCKRPVDTENGLTPGTTSNNAPAFLAVTRPDSRSNNGSIDQHPVQPSQRYEVPPKDPHPPPVPTVKLEPASAESSNSHMLLESHNDGPEMSMRNKEETDGPELPSYESVRRVASAPQPSPRTVIEEEPEVVRMV